MMSGIPKVENDNVQDCHFKIISEFDCRGYGTQLLDIKKLTIQLEILIREMTKEHSQEFKIILDEVTNIKIPRQKKCLECGTELELWDEDFYTDATHWYCPTCRMGMP